MYGMPLSQALVFLAAVIVIILATQWRRIHPFLALVAVATVFGFIAGFPTSYLAGVFSTGFSEKIYSPGLVIIAAAFIGALADSAAATDRLRDALERWHWSKGNGVAACLGLVAGLGASAAGAFALLSPLLPALGGDPAKKRDGSTVRARARDFRKSRPLGIHPGADRGRRHPRRRMEPRCAIRPAARGHACGIRGDLCSNGRRRPASLRRPHARSLPQAQESKITGPRSSWF